MDAASDAAPTNSPVPFRASEVYRYLKSADREFAQIVLDYRHSKLYDKTSNDFTGGYAASFSPEQARILDAVIVAIDVNTATKYVRQWIALKARDAKSNPLLEGSVYDRKGGAEDMREAVRKELSEFRAGKEKPAGTGLQTRKEPVLVLASSGPKQ